VRPRAPSAASIARTARYGGGVSDVEATEHLLDGLDDAQRLAVTTPDMPLAIIAGAGSGKTTVLTRRIAHRVLTGTADDRHVVAITFTRQAAGELDRRLAALGLRDTAQVGTFHALASGLLRQRWRDTNRRAPTLLTNRFELLRELAGKNPGVELPLVNTEIDWAHARRIEPSQYEEASRRSARKAMRDAGRIVEIYDAYETAKRRRGLIDFDDLLSVCLGEMERDVAYADMIRWRLRHLFVDEFQDVNPLQFALLEAWRGGRQDLCVVGDPRQSIYGWNGADPTLLETIEQQYPGIAVVRLATNYRSTPEVVAAAKSPLAAQDHPDDTRATRPEGATPLVLGAIDEVEEADIVARAVREMRRPGGRWRSIAVLARTHALLVPIAEEMTRRAIPVRVRGDRTDTMDPALRALLDEARSCTGRNALATWATDLFSLMSVGGDGPTVLQTEVADGVRRYLRDVPGEQTGPGFAEWYPLAREPEVPRDSVDLLTFHAAKGREWRSVVLVGIEVGLVPHSSASSPEAKAEEARLLHVAMTRPADTLVITYTKTRNGKRRGRSPLLAGLVEADADLTRSTWSEATSGLSLAPKPVVIHAADPWVAALEAWRNSAARAAGVPETAVLDDAALRIIAASRPESLDDLFATNALSPLARNRLGPRIIEVIAAVSQR
jgi:DNA helicase II / ATP-dependent DNA helicase PcrA